VPLFHALDGKDSNDYVARVEPSPRGGRKMPEFILNLIEKNEIQSQTGATSSGRKLQLLPNKPPQRTYMEDR